MKRWRLGIGGLGLALLFVASLEAQVTPFAERIFNEQVLRPSGQPVIPLYEGYYQNPDGTYEICFGYINLNTEEELDLPLGPNNFMEPAQYDGMQPTHFDHIPEANYRRHFCVFTVTVPEDFGDGTVVWTVTTRGEAISVPGKVLPSYVLDEPDSGGRGEIAPVLKFDPNGPEFKGRTGFTAEPRTVSVGAPLGLTVYVGHPAERSWVAWTHHQGPGSVQFSQSEIQVDKMDGMARTTARFSEPGKYLIRVQGIRTTASFEFHCCWTNGYIPVTVR